MLVKRIAPYTHLSSTVYYVNAQVPDQEVVILPGYKPIISIPELVIPSDNFYAEKGINPFVTEAVAPTACHWQRIYGGRRADGLLL